MRPISIWAQKKVMGMDNSQMKAKLVKQYYCHIWQILKTVLNSKNKVTSINTLLVYSFGIVNWPKKLRREIKQSF
jgi:hypothetical protein